jgi:hypothetical protein
MTERKGELMKRLIAISSLAAALCLPFAAKAQSDIDDNPALFASADDGFFFTALALPQDDGAMLFAEAQRLPPPPGDMAQQQQPGFEQPGHHMGGKGSFGMRQSLESKMAVANPEKFAELKKLREQESAIVKDFLAKDKAEREAFKKLLDDYKANPTDELKGKIRESVASRFDAQLKAKEVRLAEMSKKLEDVKKDKDSFVDKTLDKVLSGKDQPKDGACPMMRGKGSKGEGSCPMMKGPKPEGKSATM